MATTGYRRKYTITLLNRSEVEIVPKKNARQIYKKKYDEAVRQALLTIWHAANQICSKRLVPFIPDLLTALERFGHLSVSMEVRCVRHLEYRVKMQYKKLSPEVIRQELLKVQAGIIKDNATGKKYLLPTKITQEAKHLYRVIGVKPPDQIQAIL